MAVLRSKDGLDIMLDCSCGCCEGIRIRIDKFDENSYSFLSYTNSSFYRGQNESFWSVFKKKIKKIWCIIRNKDCVYSELCLTKSDIAELKEYLADF